MGGKPRVSSRSGDGDNAHEPRAGKKKKQQLALELVAEERKSECNVAVASVVNLQSESRRRLRQEILRRLEASKVFS